MCGIAGLLDTKSRRGVDKDVLLRMRDTMVSRGPDEAGVFTSEGVGLAHRRLSIIDLAAGQQPMSSQDGAVTLTYNGEIYNFRDVGRTLGKLGYTFRTNSDTEVLLNAWIEWGVDCVKQLRGMFAFAVWDKNRDTLFLARDRLGIKPLYYATTRDGFFAFASEMKGLTCVPGIDLSISLPSVEDYFTFGYVPEPKSIYSGVLKLEPGYSLEVSRADGQVLRQYWDVEVAGDCPSEFEAASGELIRRLTEAVDLRLMSEVPLGAFLSGGVDSSAVVSLMAELSDEAVNTCSIGFDVAGFDESDYARKVSDRYQTNHHTAKMSEDDYHLIEQLPSIYDEPFSDSSALPTLRVCELARKHVTVVLSGDGADETLAGYRRQRLHFNEERVRRLLPIGIRKAVFSPLGRYYPKADWAPRVFRAKTTFQSLARSSVAAYLESVSQNTSETRAGLFNTDFRKELGGYTSLEVFQHHAERAPREDPLSTDPVPGSENILAWRYTYQGGSSKYEALA